MKIVLLGCLLLLGPLRAELRLPALFGDHMVLQRERPIPVWGRADPETEVRVRLGDRRRTTRAAANGSWRVSFPARKVGDPLDLVIEAGDDTRRFTDLLVGEVWICSGQSNMEWPLHDTARGDTYTPRADLPRLRLFRVSRNIARRPDPVGEGEWQLSSPKTAEDFSAVGWHFGREILETQEVPVGLIQAAWSGTRIQSWMPAETLASFSFERHSRFQADAFSNEAHRPSALYNGMLHALLPFPAQGVIWYQGESNAGTPEHYRKLFPALIREWRKRAENPDLHFLYVQLANFRAPQRRPSEGGWAWIREAQGAALDLPRTAETVILDAGEAYDIHPRDKRTPAHRLALHARALVYGEDIPHRHPRLKEADPLPDGAMRLTLAHTYGRLRTRDDKAPRGFAVRAAGGNWVWAKTKITGPDTLRLSHPRDRAVAHVRYAWASNPAGNLVNRIGHPLAPFRTDDDPRE